MPQLRVPLPHLGGAVFVDEPLWDLSAPRAACEPYITAVCADLRLDWQAHTLIMRQMKDGIDAASQARGREGAAVMRWLCLLAGLHATRTPPRLAAPVTPSARSLLNLCFPLDFWLPSRALTQGLASGSAPVVAPPAHVHRAQPSQMPRVLLAQEQATAVPEQPGKAAAAASGPEEDMPDLPP